MMNTEKDKQKHNLKRLVNPKVRDYGSDPFFVKKADDSKEFLEKHGFPKAFQRRSENS